MKSTHPKSGCACKGGGGPATAPASGAATTAYTGHRRLLCRLPPASIRTITLNLAQPAGPRVNARGVSPSSGTYFAATDSPFLASGSRSFIPANPNASGHSDWVLLFDSTQ